MKGKTGGITFWLTLICALSS